MKINISILLEADHMFWLNEQRMTLIGNWLSFANTSRKKDFGNKSLLVFTLSTYSSPMKQVNPVNYVRVNSGNYLGGLGK